MALTRSVFETNELKITIQGTHKTGWFLQVLKNPASVHHVESRCFDTYLGAFVYANQTYKLGL